MLRNYPEVLDFTDESEFVIFIPDYYLNSIKVADYVDPTKGEEYEKHCKKAATLYPERKIKSKLWFQVQNKDVGVILKNIIHLMDLDIMNASSHANGI